MFQCMSRAARLIICVVLVGCGLHRESTPQRPACLSRQKSHELVSEEGNVEGRDRHTRVGRLEDRTDQLLEAFITAGTPRSEDLAWVGTASLAAKRVIAQSIGAFGVVVPMNPARRVVEIMQVRPKSAVELEMLLDRVSQGVDSWIEAVLLRMGQIEHEETIELDLVEALGERTQDMWRRLFSMSGQDLTTVCMVFGMKEAIKSDDAKGWEEFLASRVDAYSRLILQFADPSASMTIPLSNLDRSKTHSDKPRARNLELEKRVLADAESLPRGVRKEDLTFVCSVIGDFVEQGTPRWATVGAVALLLRMLAEVNESGFALSVPRNMARESPAPPRIGVLFWHSHRSVEASRLLVAAASKTICGELLSDYKYHLRVRREGKLGEAIGYERKFAEFLDERTFGEWWTLLSIHKKGVPLCEHLARVHLFGSFADAREWNGFRPWPYHVVPNAYYSLIELWMSVHEFERFQVD